ncbi:MAG: hypothetical protein Q9227_000870 [Pyrenula ochraceoflavens]
MKPTSSQSAYVSSSRKSISSSPIYIQNEDVSNPFKSGALRSRHIIPKDLYIPVGCLRIHNAIKDTSIVGEKRCRRNYVLGPNAREIEYPSTTLDALKQKSWILTNHIYNSKDENSEAVQISVLPEDVARKYHLSASSDIRKGLKAIIDCLDGSFEVWNGNFDTRSPLEPVTSAMMDDESLFYIFNTLKSPESRPVAVSDAYASEAIYDLMNDGVGGIRTVLYPYQKRSAALMVQREVVKRTSPDPRLQKFRGPEKSFYYNREEGALYDIPYFYEQPRGGILAETMGYGKTLICLAVIMATRGHYAKIPDGYLAVPTEPRPQVGSLVEMAAAKTVEHSVPWVAYFQAYANENYDFLNCKNALNDQCGQYVERLPVAREGTRSKQSPQIKTITLSYSTLVIVPPNLLEQWKGEIRKHVQSNGLKWLEINGSTDVIPHANELRQYDVILITKNRFEQEYRDNDQHTGKQGRGESVFRSPLTDLRFLRCIVDEGHAFAGSSTKTNATAMLDKMHIERRWVVSGTPSNTLIGVEVGLAANQTNVQEPSNTINHEAALSARKTQDPAQEEKKDLDKLKSIVVNFLKIQPWCNTKDNDHADWAKYIRPLNPHDGTRGRSATLRSMLQDLIIRHRIADVEVELPDLSNRITYLEPSYFDKLSINLFNAVLAGNAVTSERTDEDYMFHTKNRKQLDVLMTNLRQSSFHWVGFKSENMQEVIKNSTKYLDNHNDTISGDDRSLLEGAIRVSQQALETPAWGAFSTLHEIGVFVNRFPENACETWSLDSQITSPLLLGTLQARKAQEFVDKRLSSKDPTEGLGGEGIRAMSAAKKRASEEEKTVSKDQNDQAYIEERKLKDKSTANLRTRSMKKRAKLEKSSPLAETKIVGFSSAKLSYLVDRVLALQSSEKIIIFYDNNNIAYWIAEALELVAVKFLIYSNTLDVNRRAKYLRTFNEKEDFRVLLMDIKQAAHGLHVAAASRVFIVNPIWQASIESQAIKRAHRIGQSRPVFVETLVLKDTLEDRMLQRRRQMSFKEQTRAEKSLLDDHRMEDMIKNNGFLPMSSAGVRPPERMAKLDIPQQLFGRDRTGLFGENPDDGLVGMADAEKI